MRVKVNANSYVVLNMRKNQRNQRSADYRCRAIVNRHQPFDMEMALNTGTNQHEPPTKNKDRTLFLHGNRSTDY